MNDDSVWDFTKKKPESVEVLSVEASLQRFDGSDRQALSVRLVPAVAAHLTHLDVSHNQLTELPSLKTLPLRRLDASFNKLSALPTCPESLEELFVAHNDLTSLDGLPEQLLVLRGAHNRLTTLDDLSSLSRLERVSVFANKLSVLPTQLPFKTLRWLDLSENNIVCSIDEKHRFQEQFSSNCLVDISVPDQIDDLLFLGDLGCAYNVPVLNHLGIEQILSLCSLDEKVTHGCHFHLELQDRKDEDLLSILSPAFQFLDCGHLTLIHCNAGVSRSASVVVAYVMQRDHLSLEQALEFVRRARPQIEPNEGFMEQLSIFEDGLRH